MNAVPNPETGRVVIFDGGDVGVASLSPLDAFQLGRELLAAAYSLRLSDADLEVRIGITLEGVDDVDPGPRL